MWWAPKQKMPAVVMSRPIPVELPMSLGSRAALVGTIVADHRTNDRKGTRSQRQQAEVERLRAAKAAAYDERSRLVAVLARLYPSGVQRTAIDDVDLLIFDYPATTTLSVGLSTDRPVVLIDHGTMRFNDPAAAMIARRCRIVPTSYNDRNLPEVDGEALADAVLSGPDRAEPSDFRALFLDDC